MYCPSSGSGTTNQEQFLVFGLTSTGAVSTSTLVREGDRVVLRSKATGMFCKLVPNASRVALVQCNVAAAGSATVVNYREVAGFSYLVRATQLLRPALPAGLCSLQVQRCPTPPPIPTRHSVPCCTRLHSARGAAPSPHSPTPRRASR
jgi:hypothetical protein